MYIQETIKPYQTFVSCKIPSAEFWSMEVPWFKNCLATPNVRGDIERWLRVVPVVTFATWFMGNPWRNLATRPTMNHRLNMSALRELTKGAQPWTKPNQHIMKMVADLWWNRRLHLMQFVGHGREMLVHICPRVVHVFSPWDRGSLHKYIYLHSPLTFLGSGTNQYGDRTTPYPKGTSVSAHCKRGPSQLVSMRMYEQWSKQGTV